MPFLAILTKFVPTKDLVIGALVVGLLILSWHFHEKYVDAINYATTVKAESVVALKAANDKIAADKVEYAAQHTKDLQTYENTIQTSNAQHSAELDRLRSFATTGKGSTVLPSPTGWSTAPIAGLPDRMANLFVDAGVCANVVNDLRQTRAALALSYAERDSLTGK